jgi:TolB-like protein/tetratricopeptide (TPR) repeat protein
LEVFDRPETFDPLVDPIVRIEAGRLRERLRDYYETQGQHDPIRIELPKGSYAPLIELRQAAKIEPGSIQPDASQPDQKPDVAQAPIAPTETQPAPEHHWLNHHMRWQTAAMAAALFLVVGAAVAWLARDHQPSAPEATAGAQEVEAFNGPAIAVLPFINLSGDPKQEYFSDGLTELSRGRDLRVLARNATFQYKGQAIDVMKLGRELKARYVLEGSVRRSGDRLRVTAQLIDTETGVHVWAERYDREMADVFLVQDEIVSRIVGNIAGNRGVIEFAEGKSATRKGLNEIQAYDLILRAQDVMRPEWNRETFRTAQESLRHAIALDPLNARAHRELAYLAALGWVYRFDETPVPPQEIAAQATKAVQLDPDDARARVVLASIYFWTKQLDLFEREAQLAIALAPYDGEILASLGCMFARSGQWKRGVELAEKANALNDDAAFGWYQSTMVSYSYVNGDYERALALRRQHPDQKAIHAYMDYIVIYGQLGRKQDALEYWRKLQEVDQDRSAETFLKWYHLWNMRDEDIAKFMDGVMKSGVLEADAKPRQ